MIPFAPLLQIFFTDYLMNQRDASPNTVVSYRDSFCLLLRFARGRLGKAPADLFLEDVDAPLIGAFLDHLEQDRGSGPRTRNSRLSAIRSFFRYLSFRVPERAGLIQRVLAIPQKRCDKDLVDFLTRPEYEALLAAPEKGTWIGRRDHAILLLVLQTGLRVSEMAGLLIEQLTLSNQACLRCRGKGRKERPIPLTRQTVTTLRLWLKERGGGPSDPVFPSLRGGALSRDAVEKLVAKYAKIASEKCPSLAEKHVTPHVLRHTNAVELLQAGVDRAVIALWLGHESVETTQVYLDADLKMREAALARLAPPGAPPGRFQADDALLSFLGGLGLCRPNRP
jgi:site-specific recombinase XerD